METKSAEIGLSPMRPAAATTRIPLRCTHQPAYDVAGVAANAKVLCTTLEHASLFWAQYRSSAFFLLMNVPYSRFDSNLERASLGQLVQRPLVILQRECVGDHTIDPNLLRIQQSHRPWETKRLGKRPDDANLVDEDASRRP
jgi:hypothetical protein